VLLSWSKRIEEVEPYSQLAEIYDDVMRHVRYRQWAGYVAGLFSKSPLPVRRVLDISCGTGSMALELARLGFGVSGFDYSWHMVKQARLKAHGQHAPLQFWCASMTDFTTRRRYDAIICTYDSLNYCRTPQQCTRVFEKAYEALLPGGLLIFDVCTEKNSKQHFQNYYERDAIATCEYIRQSSYDRKTRIQSNEFIFRWAAQPNKTFKERHLQRIYRLDDLREIVLRTHLRLIGLYDGFTRRDGTEKSDRVHFVLEKPQR